MSSITEIEAAIKKLAPDDFSKLLSRISLLQAQLDKAEKAQNMDFNGAMDKVLDHHAPLLKELSR